MDEKLEHFTYDRDSPIATRPTYIIEVILAITSFLFGLYACSPLFRPIVQDPQPDTFSTNYNIRVVLAFILFFLPAAISFGSIFFWRLRANFWRRRASFTQFSGWFFIAMLQLINSGFYPVTWIFSLALCFIAGVCHINTRVAMRLEADARPQ